MYLAQLRVGSSFPGFLTQILREGFTEFGKSMRGYLTNEAIYMRQSRGLLLPFVFLEIL
jgi:hypothetical protein